MFDSGIGCWMVFFAELTKSPFFFTCFIQSKHVKKKSKCGECLTCLRSHLRFIGQKQHLPSLLCIIYDLQRLLQVTVYVWDAAARLRNESSKQEEKVSEIVKIGTDEIKETKNMRIATVPYVLHLNMC